MTQRNGGAPGAVYDADAQVDALRRPQIKVGGRLYTGQVLSSEQVAPYFASLDALIDLQAEADQATNGDQGAMAVVADRLERVNVALRPLLRTVFPRPRLRLPWQRDPVDAIMALPLAVRTEWLQDFFVCVRSWLQTSSTQNQPSSGSGAST